MYSYSQDFSEDWNKWRAFMWTGYSRMAVSALSLGLAMNHTCNF